LKKIKHKYITRPVLILSLVSLFTDMASEMLYPVLPVFLQTIGFSMVLIGVLEGFAEAIAGLSKGYFGKLSDNTGKRVPFVRYGYLLSAISKPMMAAFTWPLWIFFARTTDRVGKGIRTGARDALLSDEATIQSKGRIFGFHRSMDTLGAVMGPLIALIFLYFLPGRYRLIFVLAFIPGLLAIGLTYLLKEKKKIVSTINKTSFFDFIRYIKTSPPAYRKVVLGLLIFALINSSDVFLLLKIKEAGFSDTVLIGAYIFYNLVFALLAYPLGILADKIGLKKIFILGLGLFAIVYFGMAFSASITTFGILFFIYGIYAASTEGISKAWITNLSSNKDTATAIGTYTAFQSICALVASTLAGFIWYQFGPNVLFILSASVSVLIAFYFMSLPTGKSSSFQ
jgi:MFS family permease